MITETSTTWIALVNDVHYLVIIGIVLVVILGLSFIKNLVSGS